MLRITKKIKRDTATSVNAFGIILAIAIALLIYSVFAN